jgi:3,4-dihydroxy 2-butanone 4-phosphate synthase/GTP cyclohydrolase II
VIVLLYKRENPEDLLERASRTESSPPVIARTDLRGYGIGAQILKDLNVGRMRLLAVPRKMPSMTGFGLEVAGYLTPKNKKTK